MNKKELAEYAEKRRKAAAETARERIQTTALVDTLQNFALGKGTECTKTLKNGKVTKYTTVPKLTGARLKAIELLLDKSVPDLSAIKHEVEVSHMTFNINTNHPKQKAS